MARRITVLVAVQSSRRPPVFVAQGRPLGGARDGLPTRGMYTASLSKQLTAALRLDCSCGPVWARHRDAAGTVAAGTTVMGGDRAAAAPGATTLGVYLPTPTSTGCCRPAQDRTTPAVVAALRRVSSLPSPPGYEFRYSNAGYVCL